MGSWEASGKSNDWYTPKFIFDALNVTFELDVAAPPEGPRYVPCRRWLSENALGQAWTGLVWMNPPYGGRNELTPWVERFIQHGNELAILPDRTSAPFFAPIGRGSDAVLFMSRKVQFERPDGSLGTSPGNGSVLVACGVTAKAALIQARPLGPSFLTVGCEK